MSSTPVVFILASNYSGSHLLARLLDGHSACASIGEVRNLEKFLARPGPNASGTVADFAVNPLFAGLTEAPASTWHRLLLERLRVRTPGLTTLIDNSKRLDWLRQCRAPGTQVAACCIHLLRDPRALVRRWRGTLSPAQRRRVRLKEARRQWRPRLLTAADAELYAYRWLRENLAITATLTQLGAPTVTVSYEELVGTPSKALTRLMPALALTFEPGQLRPDGRPEAGTRKPAWSEANEDSVLQPDLRWRDDVSLADQQRIQGLRPLSAYLTAQGYTMTDQGLLPTVGHSC